MADNRDLKFPSSGSDDANSSLPQPLIERIEALYRETPAPLADQVQRCASAVRDGIARGLPVPSRFRVRYWVGAAAAAALVVAVSLRSGLVKSGDGARDAVTVGSATEGNNGTVQFLLNIPTTAAKVSIVGDWNGWDTTATPMERAKGKGAWSAKVALPPGRHVYAYVINGERWIVDPLAPQADAGFGPANALVVDGAF